MMGNQDMGNSPISTLVDLIRYRKHTEPEKTSYIFLDDGEDQEAYLSYRDFDQRARAIGAALQRKYSQGDRVVLLFPPGLEFIMTFFGCLFAGLVAVPTYPPNFTKIKRSMPRFLSILSDAKPKAVLTTSEIIELSKPIFAYQADIQSLDWLVTDDIPNANAESWEMPTINEDTLAFLQYTSGSTSMPKGVMVSHKNVLYNSKMIKRAFENSSEDTIFSWLPAYHDMGLIGGIIHPVYIGATGILMSPLHFIQRPFRWLRAISKYKVTASGGPNFGYDWCTKRINATQRSQLDLSSWRLAFNGAEPVRPETLKNFSETFAECGFQPQSFYPCYGLAEATLFVTGGLAKEAPTITKVNRHELLKEFEGHDDGDEKLQDFVSSGINWLDQEIAIVDPETRQKCKPGKVGEVWVSGPHIAQGYWQNPTATEESFKAYTADLGEGPFMRTGDLGFIKGDELYIAGRLKDLIIIDGLNHYPQDIEATVENSHLGIRQGFTVAFSIDESGSERLVIVAEYRQRYKDSVLEAKKAVQKAVAEDHEIRVHDVVFIQMRTMAKTASGKHQRNLCKTEYLSNQLSLFKAE